jgi:hypothetical protein
MRESTPGELAVLRAQAGLKATKSSASRPPIDPTSVKYSEVVGLKRPIGGRVVLVKVYREPFAYAVDPNKLAPEVFAQVNPGIQAMLLQATEAKLAGEHESLRYARAQIALLDRQDAEWKRDFLERTSYLNLAAEEARQRITEVKKAAKKALSPIPSWVWTTLLLGGGLLIFKSLGGFELTQAAAKTRAAKMRKEARELEAEA